MAFRGADYLATHSIRCRVSGFSISPPCLKLHSIRQDLLDYQYFLSIMQQYLVHPLDPVKK